MNTQQASGLLIIGALLWGTNPALIQLADWTPFGTAWLRGCFCFALLLTYLLYKKSFSLKSIQLQLLCAVFLALNSTLFVSASLYTSPANAVLLLFIFPWITLLLDFSARKIKPSFSDIIRLLLGLTGIVIIVWGGLRHAGTLGNILALLGGICIAFNIFFSQRLERRHKGNKEVLSSVMVAWLITIIGLAPLALANESLRTSPLAQEQWFYLILFGLFSAIPWLLWGKAIAYIPGHIVAALLGVEVFSAALFGWLLLGDSPSLETWVGGTLTLIAAMWQILSSIPRPKK
ncbi:MAG: drug/metabolite transporter (DMT)-like permease [Cellvibrionaceae bacterium]|jgi:drug/metabolite transporter (DMT)-like permease